MLFNPIGCWKDGDPRTLVIAEESRPHISNPTSNSCNFLHGPYKTRKDPIENCYKTAKCKKRKIFALQDGGQCFISGPNQPLTAHEKYNRSTACGVDGKGGPLANEVYEIKPGSILIFNAVIYVLIFLPFCSKY